MTSCGRTDFQPVPAEIAEEARAAKSTVPRLGLRPQKLRIPESVWEPLSSHWNEVRKHLVPRAQEENRFLKNLHGIHPTTLFHEDAGFNLTLREELRPIHESWAGEELEGTSCYGIRVYRTGSYLHPHVDRPDTHIVSSTLCIAKDLDAPWPLWIERDGEVEEVELEPGEMLFYESATQEHGRPYPLLGRYYAGMFAHYRPRSWA